MKLNHDFFRPFLKAIYKKGRFYKVVFGKIRGLKLYYTDGINFSYLLGAMEKDQFSILTGLFQTFGLDNKKIVVADIGANMGYYSLFFFKILNRESNIFSFEPTPYIFDILEKNIKANSADNIEAIKMACADKTGTTEFYIGNEHYNSSLLSEWADHKNSSDKYEVACTTLDDFFYTKKGAVLPDFIKMDIEGGGVYALKGCDRCITEKRPLMLIESHNPDEDKAIGEVLLKYNYEAFRINDKKWVTHKNNDYHDADGVWGTMILLPQELKSKYPV